ncbi:MAG: hypothetical protein ABIJ37_01360 [Pseudomonadota bacterium]
MDSSNIQEEAVKIVEDFFLNRTDKDVYAFIQEVLGRPLAEKMMEKNEANKSETARIIGLLYGSYCKEPFKKE